MSLKARQLGGKNQSRKDKQRAGKLGGKRSGATRQAKAAAAKVAAAVAELEAEGRAMDAALAALQERALPKLASLMYELAVLRAGLRFSS